MADGSARLQRNCTGVGHVRLLGSQESAIEGRGLAMTIGPFASEEIKMSRLEEPFQMKVEHKHHWFFACNAEHHNKNKIKRFEEWLVKQVAADPMLEVLKDDKK